MPDKINIVEPTLESQAGHCYSFVSAFCQAGEGKASICLWAGRHAELPLPHSIHVRRHFHRSLRRLQSYFLYRKLLAAPGKLFVSTASHLDLILVDWAAGATIPPGKAWFYFHWVNAAEKKLPRLRKIARRQPALEILAPTPTVAAVFREAGFRNVQVVPYPVSVREIPGAAEANGFRHVLYAGAARQDKGFRHVVDLVGHMQESRLRIPVVMQTSSEHYGKYDEATRLDLQRLQQAAYPALRLCAETLSPGEYEALFAGAVCLQLYDAADFADRVSGVTLDAFAAGSPVVALAGSWIARMVERFGAGVVVRDASPPSVLAAVNGIITEYARYSAFACEAGKVLQRENSAAILFDLVAGSGGAK